MSVHLSVILCYCVQTIAHILKRFTPIGNAIILFLPLDATKFQGEPLLSGR